MRPLSLPERCERSVESLRTTVNVLSDEVRGLINEVELIQVDIDHLSEEYRGGARLSPSELNELIDGSDDYN